MFNHLVAVHLVLNLQANELAPYLRRLPCCASYPRSSHILSHSRSRSARSGTACSSLRRSSGYGLAQRRVPEINCCCRLKKAARRDSSLCSSRCASVASGRSCLGRLPCSCTHLVTSSTNYNHLATFLAFLTSLRKRGFLPPILGTGLFRCCLSQRLVP